jgi:hypothetical protein
MSEALRSTISGKCHGNLVAGRGLSSQRPRFQAVVSIQEPKQLEISQSSLASLVLAFAHMVLLISSCRLYSTHSILLHESERLRLLTTFFPFPTRAC